MREAMYNLLVLSIVGVQLGGVSAAPVDAQESKTTTSASPTNAPGKADVLTYLTRYHQRSSIAHQLTLSENEIDDKALAKQIVSFQKFHGLKPTGVLDEATKKLMNTPRCGMPDIISTNSSQTGRRRKRYTPSGYSWPSWKRSLTYKIGSSPSSSISQQTVANRIQQAYQKWTDVVPPSRLTINPAGSGQTADININFYSGSHSEPVPPSYPFDGPLGTLAHTYFPTLGHVHFDNAELWTDGPGDTQQNNRNAIYFYLVALHEFGHSLGLAHSTNPSAIMAPYYRYTPTVQLTADDIQGIQSLYGVGVSSSTPAVAPSSPAFPIASSSAQPPSASSLAPTPAPSPVPTNPCSSNPCPIGSTCVSSGTGYTCSSSRCIGRRCSNPTNPCSSNPCQNQGACMYDIFTNTYSCICQNGWTGTTCNTPITCANNPCRNGATCNNSGNSYTCSCTSQWSGTNCDIPINPCLSNPCQNGGTCYPVFYNTYFVCYCPAGWAGLTCGTAARWWG